MRHPIYDLLENSHGIDRWAVEYQEEREHARNIFRRYLDTLQGGCPHSIVLRSTRIRICWDCGLYQFQTEQGGDEFNYGYYVWPNKELDPAPGREVYEVDPQDVFAHRSIFTP